VSRDGATYAPTFARWFEPGIYEELGFRRHTTLTPAAVHDYIASSGGMAPEAGRLKLVDNGASPGVDAPMFGSARSAGGRKVTSQDLVKSSGGVFEFNRLGET